MFLSRGAYEGLIRENARLAASCDWLAQLVTQLQTERAILLNRVLEVQIPVMSIAREERPTAKDEPLTPEMLARLSAQYIPPMDASPGKVYRPVPDAPVPTALGEAMAAMSMFEDMGDAAADRAGVVWSPAGDVEFSR